MASRSSSAAVIDAVKTQKSILRECERDDLQVPPYVLRELIGKGSFGRVYQANNVVDGAVVAVKIISIEEADRADPHASDTIGDVLKEINTLKLLSENGAKNINRIFDAFNFGHSVWMVTQYAAGSVATLMRPTGYLSEEWAVPILREVAEAIFWVHKNGIIHRDIKCANVLVTETGDVQLCDFGVAALLQPNTDKRRSVIGTLHWMAPELFDQNPSYGKDIDIWAFGAMAYELITGSPPNATRQIDENFGTYLRNHCPRLDGDHYSDSLKDLIAVSMIHEPSLRPSIQLLQTHPYIHKSTAKDFPTSSLSRLVAAYKVWERHGGHRRSLFTAVGAQGVVAKPPFREDWDFDEEAFERNKEADTTTPTSSTTHNREETQQHIDDEDAQLLDQVYGINPLATATPLASSRRRPPPNIPTLRSPLEQVFDPNTIISYKDNANSFYRSPQPMTPSSSSHLPHPSSSDFPPSSSSDLPLRDNLNTQSPRESLIDLDQALDLTPSMDTIKPKRRAHRSPAAITTDTLKWKFPESSSDKSRPATPTGREASSTPTKWTFPSMSLQQGPATTPSMEQTTMQWKFPKSGQQQNPAAAATTRSPPKWTLPKSGDDAAPARLAVASRRRDSGTSMTSLIDLDAALVKLGSHASLIDLDASLAHGGPSASRADNDHSVVNPGPVASPSPSPIHPPPPPGPSSANRPSVTSLIDLDAAATLPTDQPARPSRDYPAAPLPPSGTADRQEQREELRRLFASFGDHLELAGESLRRL